MSNRYQSLLLVLAVPLAACPIGAPYVGNHPISCSSTSDCQPGEICDTTYGTGYCIAAPDAGTAADGGPTGCQIGGVTYPAGALDPTTPCQSCQPSLSTAKFTAYSGLPADGGCQAGQVCNAGQCAAGCYVDQAFRATGALAAGNGCLTCDPSKSETNWTPLTGVPQGGGCPAGEVCAAGSCSAGCVIGGAFVAAGAGEPGAGCQGCMPAQSLTAWTPLTGLVTGVCGAGEVCHQGACAVGCYLDGGYVADGGLEAVGGCLACDPGTSVGQWSSVADDTSCAGGGFCRSGACENGCLVQGQFYAPGAGSSADVCQACDPAGSGGTTSFSPVSGVVACATGGGNYCVSGACAAACVVGSTVYGTGSPAPTNECESCQPATSATSFSADSDGTSCTQGGNYCKGGSCGSYCDISGTGLVADKALDGQNPNECCNVALGPQAWTAGLGGAMTTPIATSSPVSVAIGDVTGDGIPDLVVGEENPGQLEIYKGKGDGTFTLQAPALPFPSGASPVVLADFNNDKLQDIAVANNGSNSVTVLLNQGDGGFAATTIGVGSSPTALVVADLQHPGSRDLAVGDLGLGANAVVRALANNGSGAFVTGALVNVPQAVTGLAAGSFANVAGEVDLAATGSNLVTVLTNSSNGTSLTPNSISVASTGSLAGIAAGDLNGDNRPDLVVVDQAASGQVIPLLNTGSSFAAQSAIAVGASPSSVAVVDVNGDGKPDIVAANEAASPGSISVIINQAAAGATTTLFFTPAASYPVGAGPAAIAAYDLNGDGKPDLVTANKPAKTLSILLGQCP